MSALNLSHATAIFVVDCCQFRPDWIFGWKWGLWPVPTWLAVQQSKAVFSTTLYDSINDMKLFWTISIAPQPCHSHFGCRFLPIWPYLDVWAENGAYGLCRLGWEYNGAKLYFSSSGMKVSLIWNKYEFSTLHLSRATAIFVVDGCQFRPNWVVGMKTELMACADLVGGKREQSCIFPDLIW